MSLTVFDNPPDEERYPYCVSRSDGTSVQTKVIQVTFLPTARKGKVFKSVVSEDYVRGAKTSGVATKTPQGTVLGRWAGRRNASAEALANRSPGKNSLMYGPCYLVEAAPADETWWRTAIKLNDGDLPFKKDAQGHACLKSLRRAVTKKIKAAGLGIGSFFVEAISNWQDRGHFDADVYWFDIYARRESDLVAAKMALGM